MSVNVGWKTFSSLAVVIHCRPGVDVDDSLCLAIQLQQEYHQIRNHWSSSTDAGSTRHDQ